MSDRRAVGIGFAAGAAAAYYFDPVSGGSRRTRLAARSTAAVRRARRRLARAERHISAEVAGRVQAATHRHHEPPADDLTLLDRVESEVFGQHLVPRGRVNADVVRGRVALRGQLDTAEEIDAIEAAVLKVPGVSGLDSYLHLPGTAAPNKQAVLAAG